MKKMKKLLLSLSTLGTVPFVFVISSSCNGKTKKDEDKPTVDPKLTEAKDALKKICQQTKANELTKYTDAKFATIKAELETAIKTAETVSNKKDVTVKELTDAKTALETAVTKAIEEAKKINTPPVNPPATKTATVTIKKINGSNKSGVVPKSNNTYKYEKIELDALTVENINDNIEDGDLQEYKGKLQVFFKSESSEIIGKKNPNAKWPGDGLVLFSIKGLKKDHVLLSNTSPIYINKKSKKVLTSGFLTVTKNEPGKQLVFKCRVANIKTKKVSTVAYQVTITFA